MFPYFPAKRLQKLRGISRSTEAPTLKFNMFPGNERSEYKQTEAEVVKRENSIGSIIYQRWGQQQRLSFYHLLARNL